MSGLFDRLRKIPNPTEGWTRASWPHLELDLDRNRLCGVGLGEQLDELFFLGPARVRRETPGWLEYPADGLIVEADGGMVFWFVVALGSENEYELQAFPGRIIWKEEEVPLSSLATEEGVRSLFGEPYWRDEDEDEAILFYEPAAGVEWEVEFTTDDRVKLISVGEPLLADAEARKTFGVTEPWPPPGAEDW